MSIISRRKKKTIKVIIVISGITALVLINVISLTRLSVQRKPMMENDKEIFTKRSVLHMKQQTILNHETTIPSQSATNTFRYYIYDLPRSLNKDILDFFQKSHLKVCCNFSEYGMGTKVSDSGYEKGSISVYGTNQFSLEVIIHEKLKKNGLRTRNPEIADIFYVPAYIGLLCLGNRQQAKIAIHKLKSFLMNSYYFSVGKPHFSTVAKIEREMSSEACPYLAQPFTNKITFIAIEKEKMSLEIETIWPYTTMINNSILLAPYPSNGHFLHSNEGELSTVPFHDRDIFILLPVSERRTNLERSKLMDQFDIRTKLPYSRYRMCYENQTSNMVLFFTNECGLGVKNDLYPWMQHSIFCLQPPGDSPSRKSFYDSILCGCIPVILTSKDHHNPYAFQEFVNYNTFTVSIEIEKIIKQDTNIFHILKDISKSRIQKLQNKLREIAKYMQYSIPSDEKERESDALQLIFQKISSKYNLPYDKSIKKI